MEIRKITVNNNEYQFINSYRNTRTGFAHDTTLFINGREWGKATKIYYNRTWERYTYQSVMQECIGNIIAESQENFIAGYKNRRNIKRLTAEKRAEANRDFEALETTKELKEVLKALDLNEYGY